MPDESNDDSLLKAAPMHLGPKSLFAPSSSMESVRTDDGCPQWLQALDRLLPAALIHSAPMVIGQIGCFR